MEVNKDKNQKHKRVVIQLHPLKKENLIEIQDFVKADHEEFKRYQPQWFHLTLFHFGKPQELYEEITKHLTATKTYENFYTKFISLLETLEYLKKTQPITLDTKHISFYGNDEKSNTNYAVVTELENSKKLRSIRKNIIETTDKWFYEIGIKNPKKFYQESINFKYNLLETYRPHVTVGRISSRAPLPKHLNIKKRKQITFGNLSFFNVSNS